MKTNAEIIGALNRIIDCAYQWRRSLIENRDELSTDMDGVDLVNALRKLDFVPQESPEIQLLVEIHRIEKLFRTSKNFETAYDMIFHQNQHVIKPLMEQAGLKIDYFVNLGPRGDVRPIFLLASYMDALGRLKEKL